LERSKKRVLFLSFVVVYILYRSEACVFFTSQSSGMAFILQT
jgi:hypothetical protein